MNNSSNEEISIWREKFLTENINIYRNKKNSLYIRECFLAIPSIEFIKRSPEDNLWKLVDCQEDRD